MLVYFGIGFHSFQVFQTYNHYDKAHCLLQQDLRLVQKQCELFVFALISFKAKVNSDTEQTIKSIVNRMVKMLSVLSEKHINSQEQLKKEYYELKQTLVIKTVYVHLTCYIYLVYVCLL